jgi:hypothetical protein
MKRFFFLLGLVLSFPVLAFDANVTWVNATQFDDGSLIANATGTDVLASTQVVAGSCNADGTFGTQSQAVVAPWPNTSASFTGLAAGKYCFRARHTTVGGINSNWSATVSKTLGRKPKVPTSVAAP